MALADPGLQAERTALAWSRTGMGLLLNAAVLLRCGSTASDATILATGALLLFGAVATLAFAAHRGRMLARRIPARPQAVSELACAVLGLVCLVGALGGLLGVLTVARAQGLCAVDRLKPGGRPAWTLFALQGPSTARQRLRDDLYGAPVAWPGLGATPRCPPPGR